MNNEQTEVAQVAAIAERVDPPYDRTAYVGFKAPVPWDGWSDEERRKAFGGFLYPSWHPFAVCEGNYQSSMFADIMGFRAAKVQGEVDESIEQRKKQFATPMVTKKKYGYTNNGPVGTLKRKPS